MTSKTFKSIEETRELHVSRLGEDFVTLVINYKDAGRSGLTLAPSDAPALALAILETAGFVGDENMFTGLAVANLRDHVEEQERITAESREQAKLEAEALELENAGRDAAGADRIEELSEMGRVGREFILAVARRAREMRAEK